MTILRQRILSTTRVLWLPVMVSFLLAMPLGSWAQDTTSKIIADSQNTLSTGAKVWVTADAGGANFAAINDQIAQFPELNLRVLVMGRDTQADVAAIAKATVSAYSGTAMVFTRDDVYVYSTVVGPTQLAEAVAKVQGQVSTEADVAKAVGVLASSLRSGGKANGSYLSYLVMGGLAIIMGGFWWFWSRSTTTKPTVEPTANPKPGLFGNGLFGKFLGKGGASSGEGSDGQAERSAGGQEPRNRYYEEEYSDDAADRYGDRDSRTGAGRGYGAEDRYGSRAGAYDAAEDRYRSHTDGYGADDPYDSRTGGYDDRHNDGSGNTRHGYGVMHDDDDAFNRDRRGYIDGEVEDDDPTFTVPPTGEGQYIAEQHQEAHELEEQIASAIIDISDMLHLHADPALEQQFMNLVMEYEHVSTRINTNTTVRTATRARVDLERIQLDLQRIMAELV